MPERLENPIHLSTLGGATRFNDARPEMNLWLAVLDLAIKDTRDLIEEVRFCPELWNDPLFRNDARELKQYFEEQSMEPGGFGFICDLMNVDPGKFTSRLEKLYLHKLTPVHGQASLLAA